MHLAHYIGQKSYEHIIYKVRRNAFTFIPALVIFVLLLAIPIGVYIILEKVFPGFLVGPRAFPLWTLAGSGYYLFILVLAYSYFIDFYLDVLVVTNDRLIDIEQIGLFARTVSEVDLCNIQDITKDLSGRAKRVPLTNFQDSC